MINDVIYKKIIFELIRYQNFAQFYTQQRFSIVNDGDFRINIVIQYYEKCNLRYYAALRYIYRNWRCISTTKQ